MEFYWNWFPSSLLESHSLAELVWRYDKYEVVCEKMDYNSIPVDALSALSVSPFFFA